MNPFGLILLGIVFYILFKGKNLDNIFIKLLTLTICVETFISVGFFLRIGSYEVTYSEFLLFILGILSITMIITTRTNQKVLLLGYILILAIIVSNTHFVFNPINKLVTTYGIAWSEPKIYPKFNLQSILMSLRIILFVFIATTSLTVVRKNINYIRSNFIKFGTFTLLIIAFEFISKNIFNSMIYIDFVNFFFGEGDNTVSVFLERGDSYSLQGLTKEPAHLSSVLFYFGLILVLSKVENKYFNLLFFTTIIAILIGKSLSGVLTTLCLLGVFFIVKRRKFLFIYIGILIIPLILILPDMSYYFDRSINSLNFLLNKQQVDFTQSEVGRLNSIIETYKILLERPLFGVGVGANYAYGFLPTMMSNIGFLGTFSWLIFIFYGVANLNLNIKSVIVIILLLITWIPTGGLSTMYSMSLLLVLFVIRSDYSTFRIKTVHKLDYTG